MGKRVSCDLMEPLPPSVLGGRHNESHHPSLLKRQMESRYQRIGVIRLPRNDRLVNDFLYSSKIGMSSRP